MSQYQPIMRAGSIGFTFTFNVSATNPVPGTTPISTLTGCTVTLVLFYGAQNGNAQYRATFNMTVAGNGQSASYTTQAGTDVPNAGNYAYAVQGSQTAARSY